MGLAFTTSAILLTSISSNPPVSACPALGLQAGAIITPWFSYIGFGKFLFARSSCFQDQRFTNWATSQLERLCFQWNSLCALEKSRLQLSILTKIWEMWRPDYKRPAQRNLKGWWNCFSTGSYIKLHMFDTQSCTILVYFTEYKFWK